MPRRDYRERQRKKTRYSSDSSDDYREKRSRSRREKSRSKKVSSSDKYKGSSSKQESSSSNSSTSSSRSRSSSTSSEDSRSKSRATHQKKSTSVQKERKSINRFCDSMKSFVINSAADQQVKKFELDELYKEKDKVKVLEEIESDSFKQAVFKQSSSSKIIVDLEMDKIMLPVTSVATQEDQTLIHPNFLGDNEKRVDKWIKKLYIYRNQ
jgi:hypothetical protein